MKMRKGTSFSRKGTEEVRANQRREIAKVVRRRGVRRVIRW